MPRYAFVGGLHRSGTSLVTRCLAEHPRVTSFAETGVWEDEGQHLQDLLLPARLLGGPGRFARHAGARGPVVSTKEAESARARLLAAWEPLWGANADVRVAKSPPNLLRGPLLGQLFPGSTLVVVRRHPLAVALATRAMARRFRGLDVGELVEHWVIAHEALAEQAPDLRRLVVVEHPELVTRGHSALEPALEAIGLEPKSSSIVFRDTDAKYRAQWARMRRSARPKDPLWARLTELSARVRSLGYALEGFEQESSPTGTPFPLR